MAFCVLKQWYTLEKAAKSAVNLGLKMDCQGLYVSTISEHGMKTVF